jgi:folylpolyglutamate synthase/dihydropteroate synthase
LPTLSISPEISRGLLISLSLLIKSKRLYLQFIELQDLKLQLLGDHQRQNAVTACCTALCLRELGWNISDTSIQAGLEKTQLPGRSQFLTKEETSVLGLDGTSSVLVDGGLLQ